MNAILADEMGLGKTLQTLSLFQHVRETSYLVCVNAPFLVICLLSVIDSWVSEAFKWAPMLSVLKYNGTQDERTGIKRRIANQRRFKTTPDLVVSSYDTVMSDMTWFRRAFVWKYIVGLESQRRYDGSLIRERYRRRNGRRDCKYLPCPTHVPWNFRVALTTSILGVLCLQRSRSG